MVNDPALAIHLYLFLPSEVFLSSTGDSHARLGYCAVVKRQHSTVEYKNCKRKSFK